MMDVPDLQEIVESLIDLIIDSDPYKVRKYINDIRSENPEYSNRQIAETLVNDQSLKSGLLGAITGVGGLMTLPVTISVDIVKALKIQAFTIRCIAEIYGHNSENTDLKTDIFLILSNPSIDSIKNLVFREALKVVPAHAVENLNILKTSLIKEATKQAPKYLAKTAIQLGGKTLRNYALRGVPTMLRGIIWKLGGRKVAEKALQKSIGKAIPILGAVIGGGIDWLATQAVGELAIEYYENSMSNWVNDVFNLCE